MNESPPCSRLPFVEPGNQKMQIIASIWPLLRLENLALNQIQILNNLGFN
jgi:hypothetical protein